MATAEPKSIISSFNTLSLEFMDAMQTAFPSEKNIAKHKKLFQRVIKANKRAPIRNFKEQSSPYREQIMNRDDQYFLGDNNFMNVMLSADGSSEHKDNDSISKAWGDLNDTTKEVLWEYLQSLFFLAQAYN